MRLLNILLITFLYFSLSTSATAQGDVDKRTLETIQYEGDKIEDQVIEWRRHLHEHPELSNREFETAKYIAAHLRELGIEVITGVAHTGVVGILKGGGAGPVVALRADMDGLPVTERVDVPFASKVRSTYQGVDVGVMHACGHDTHVAMLMGAAEILVGMKDELNGTVVFLFQPAEEGPPPGEEGGAELMIKEGIYDKYKIDVTFGLHIKSTLEVGQIYYKPGGFMAAADLLVIKVKGKQTHGSRPWRGVDPITVSAQIIQGLNNIISRQTELTLEPAVISIGKITSGVRNNIIPEELEMIGTIRTFDIEMQDMIHEKIHLTATKIAESAGATAEVTITKQVPVTYNDAKLMQSTIPALYALAGEDNITLTRAVTGAEDFSFFANQVPSIFLFLGGKTVGVADQDAPPHHTPDFYIDESGLKLGVKALCVMTANYMAAH